MTLKEQAEELGREALAIYQEDWQKDEQRIDNLCRVVQKLAGLVAACAPEFKEAA